MSLDGRIREAMKTFLVNRGLDVSTVISFSEEYVPGGSCGFDTCWFDDEHSVEINYQNSDGKFKVFTYDGKFGDLIKELSDNE